MIGNLKRVGTAKAARGGILVLAVALLAVALLAAACSGGGTAQRAAAPDRDVARAGSEPATGGPNELQQEGDALQQRIDAFEQAKTNGTAGVAARVATNPAAGWTGEYVVDPTKDDWEPAIAADPNGPYVYALVTRIGEPSRARGTARRRSWDCCAPPTTARRGAR